MRFYLSLLLLINLSIFSPAAKAQDWVQVSSLPSSFNQTHHSFAFSFDNMGYIVTGNSDSSSRFLPFYSSPFGRRTTHFKS